mgnify:CR=1 FL=1
MRAGAGARCVLLPLKELHCEDNRFVHCKPMPSVQDAEVLALKVTIMKSVRYVRYKIPPTFFCFIFVSKELVARFVLWENRNRFSLIHRRLPHYPLLTALLANGSCCAVCLRPFLTTWLECVHFVSLRKVRCFCSLTFNKINV